MALFSMYFIRLGISYRGDISSLISMTVIIVCKISRYRKLPEFVTRFSYPTDIQALTEKSF
jgi:hypothetical protein